MAPNSAAASPRPSAIRCSASAKTSAPRADYNISDKDLLFGVYTIDDSDANTPNANPFSYVVESAARTGGQRAGAACVFPQSAEHRTLRLFARRYAFTGTTPVDVPGWIAGRPIGAIVIGGGTALNGASQISGAGTNAGSNLHHGAQSLHL